RPRSITPYQEIKANPNNYDIWFDYSRLEEQEGELSRARQVYERAIAQVPPTSDKRHWRRYIHLWIKYAIFEELVAQDLDRARAVYVECLELLPHRTFTFAKIWLLYARFEVRRKNLD